MKETNEYAVLNNRPTRVALFLIILLLGGGFLFTNQLQAVQSFSVRIASSNDDAEERALNGAVSLTSSDLELVKDGKEQVVGMRFQNVTIPPGSTISNANIVFTADEESSVSTDLIFHAEAADNAAAFTNTRYDVTDRLVTSSFVAWPGIPAWNTIGATYQTPNLAPIIQEVIERPGWSYGGSIVLVVSGTGRRTAESFDGSPSQAPLLQIEFISVPDFDPPSTPAGLTATALSSSRISLSWDASTDNVAVSGYDVYRCNGTGCTPDTFLASTDKTIYLDSGLFASTTYSYAVTAFDPAGNESGQSNISFATTLDPGQIAFYTLAGAGDIAVSGSPTGFNEATAELLDAIVADDPNSTVFTAGDNAYLDGTMADFMEKYDPTWGRHRPRTFPSPGNHDYIVAGAADYLDYFCPSSNDCVFPENTQRLYYSYDLGNWHIVSLDSNADYQAGSVQVEWLKQDLAAYQNSCILAYMHHPYYSSGGSGGSSRSTEFWKELYAVGADIVVAGHDHLYERFAKQDLNGNIDPNGIRAFIAGTGGASLHTFDNPAANSEVKYNSSRGIIKFTLRESDYDWEFIPEAGFSFSDTGTDTCNNASGDPLPSVSITNPLDGAFVSGQVTINATAFDNSAVAKVEFYVDSILIDTVTAEPYTTTWNSTSVGDGSYNIEAVVYDDASQSTSDSIMVIVNNVNDPPVADAGPDRSAATGNNVLFDGSNSVDSDGSIVNYTWDFGDGSTATSGASVSHAYAVAGTYVATLTVIDDGGLSDEDNATIIVADPPSHIEVFSDSFEVSEWNGLWIEEGKNDWLRSNQRATDGIYSAEVDGRARDTILRSVPIDLQGKSNATITFSWYIEGSLDSAEYIAFDASSDNGATWAQMAILKGNVDPEDVWLSESIDIVGISGLQVRFRGYMSQGNEDANIDNVSVIAW
jgi:PKD repeat protein